MPYVNVPNDLSKIKTKIAFNLTKRQLICFGIGAAIGVPTYLLTRQAIGNTGALFATAVSASSRLAVRIIIAIPGFGFFDLTLLCVPHDSLISPSTSGVRRLRKYTIKDGSKGSFSSS